MYKTLIVVDNDTLLFDAGDAEVISFNQYLQDYPKLNEPKTRILNLCDTEQYLSKGYYCSLLAEARQHKSLPSVSTINELRDASTSTSKALYWGRELNQINLELNEPALELLVCFGFCEHAQYKKLVRKIFEQYPSPILRLKLWREETGVCVKVERVPYANLNEHDKAFFFNQLSTFTQLVWRNPAHKKTQRWDLAILVNPDEPSPPSDPEAIARFIKAAAKFGIYAEAVTKQQLENVSHYDALFIRETTAIDHHTYRLARKAQQAGLVVIDDPISILRCCNKVFLHDAFSYQKVPSPKTHIVISCDDEQLDKLEQEFAYPMVLKMPEGAFSKGVYKVENRAELKTNLESIFTESALVLVQEYLYTDFDWRIGVLNGRAIYACRYHMARNHWQIYNHGAKRFVSGGFETLPTFEVPKAVLDAAIKASNIIGKGLYGVDIKQKDNKVYVIEVNDNPSIDHKVEDAYLGKELYMLIMAEFQQRLEQRGR